MRVKHEEWSNAEEIILAEGMLRQIRESIPVKEILNQLSKRLNRTPKTIESHWHQFVQPRYKNIIEKIQFEQNENFTETYSDDIIRKGFEEPNPLNIQSTERNRDEIINNQTVTDDESININTVITFLQNNKDVFNELEIFKKENARLELENQQLIEENKKIMEDFKIYAKILNEARNIFKDDTKQQKYNIDNSGHVVVKK